MFETNFSGRNNSLTEFTFTQPSVPHQTQTQTTEAKRPHICFVAPEAWPAFAGNTGISVVGGAEVQQSILARLLARAGYRVSMICLDYGQPAKVILEGVTVYRAYAPTAGLPGLRAIHPRITAMWRMMQEVDADIYYQRTTAMLTAVMAAFCRRHGKYSIYAGASDSDFLPGREFIRYAHDRWLFRKGLAWVDRLVVQNQRQQQDCLRFHGRPSIHIPSCYQLPRNASPGQGNNILWVSNMHRNKRPELFIELAKQLPQFRFIMIGGPGSAPGDAEFFESLRSSAMALPNLQFTGFLPLAEAEPYFDQAAVFVNTSLYEGMPNTFLQAWARGIPTLALIDVGARLAGAPVYPVAASLTEIASEIERLFADENHRQQASARCQEYFSQTHSPAKTQALYEQVFAELMSRGRA